MGLLSIFQRKADASPPPAATQKPSNESPDDVMRARVRARQRLIGAAVLVVIGIVGFPLVFETQPRPIPVDIPIEIPRKEGAAPLTMPPARAPRAASTGADAAPPAKEQVITETRDDAGKPVSPAASAAAPAVLAAAKPAETKPAEAKVAEVKPETKPETKAEPTKPETKAETKPEPKPEAKPAKPAETKPADTKPADAKSAHAGDAARAKALLEGKAESADAGRFVVQVGAFADAAAARETRQKVEKLGLKTYTQVVSTANGNRIRVRVGPFASREEADKALAKAKGAGLAGAVLTL